MASGYYANYETCNVTFTQSVMLLVTVFEMHDSTGSNSNGQCSEADSHLTIGSTRYCGTSGPNEVIATSLSWSSFPTSRSLAAETTDPPVNEWLHRRRL